MNNQTLLTHTHTPHMLTRSACSACLDKGVGGEAGVEKGKEIDYCIGSFNKKQKCQHTIALRRETCTSVYKYPSAIASELFS